ncbi:MAG: STAS domain-containing protein [Anaerolineae bacterium]|nr:STAS domain-containing protein [Anaerolineae bacterium]
MELKKEQPDDVTLVLHIGGRFDAHTMEEVKACWRSDDAIRHIVVDLSQTTFIDSIALATLISGLKTARKRGGNLVIANPAEAVKVIFELTAMDRALTVTSSVEEALALFPSNDKLQQNG